MKLMIEERKLQGCGRVEIEGDCTLWERTDWWEQDNRKRM